MIFSIHYLCAFQKLNLSQDLLPVKMLPNWQCAQTALNEIANTILSPRNWHYGFITTVAMKIFLERCRWLYYAYVNKSKIPHASNIHTNCIFCILKAPLAMSSWKWIFSQKNHPGISLALIYIFNANKFPIRDIYWDKTCFVFRIKSFLKITQNLCKIN